MIISFRDKERGLYSRCCEKYFRALRREKGVQKSSLMQWSRLIFLQAQARSVLSAWNACNVCVKCFFQKAVEVELFPRGAEGI